MLPQEQKKCKRFSVNFFNKELKMKKQDIVVAGAQLGASGYVLASWSSKRALPARWLLRVSRHLGWSVEDVESVWASK